MLSMLAFWKLLRGLLTMARHTINEQLSQLGLTSAAGDIIYHLIGEATGLSQEALCERLSIGKAAVSRTVDSLVDKGMVIREKNRQDARAYLVRLTQEGMDISKQVLAVYENVFRLIQRDIPEEDFVQASRLLTHVHKNLACGRAES